MGSLDSLRVRGMMVSFGNASGPVPPFDPLLLSQKDRSSLPADLDASHGESARTGGAGRRGTFAMVASGKIRIEVNQTYALADAAQSHIDPRGTPDNRQHDPVALWKRFTMGENCARSCFRFARSAGDGPA